MAVQTRSREINANLLKGTAALGDVLSLLRAWHPEEEDPSTFLDRAVEENLLGKQSQSRAEDVVKKVFGRRYMPGGSPVPARLLRKLLLAGESREVLDRLLYYHAALAEHLLYRVAVEVVYDLRTREVDRVRTSDVERLLDDLSSENAEDEGYAPSVRERLAQHALASLRDFGVLEGRAQKRIAAVRVPDPVVGYIAYWLREEGLSSKRIVEHEDWRLFLLHRREVEDRVIDVAGMGYFEYRTAGDIHRFDWSYDSLEDYVDALAG